MRLGIDPGVTGALTLIHGDTIVDCWDMPTKAYTVTRVKKKDVVRRRAWALGIYNILKQVNASYPGMTIYVENVRVMGGNTPNGQFGNFSLGESMSAIRSAIEILEFDSKTIWVAPHGWKSRAGLNKKPKEEAIVLCKKMFNCGDFLNRKKDIGRADAALIAQFGD